MKYECSSCGTSMESTDNKEFTTAIVEVIKITRPIGFVRGLRRVVNYWRGYFASSVMRVNGFWYCPKCHVYRLECPNCGSFVELGENSPVQGDVFTCGNCERDLIFYNENEGEAVDYPIDYGMG